MRASILILIFLLAGATCFGRSHPGAAAHHPSRGERSGELACDSLIIDAVTWAPFSDTALLVHVINFSTDLFSHPGFVLYNQNGDTLAKEVVTYFGLPVDSWHLLTVRPHPDLDLPSFMGGLELWTNLYTEQQCSWNIPIQLCPSTSCSSLLPTMMNTGDALTLGDIPWTIIDAGGTDVASGAFHLTTQDQFDQDTVCLPPGNYTLRATHPDPLAGTPQVYFTTGPFIVDTPPLPFIANATANEYPIAFLYRCSAEFNAVPERSGTRATRAWMDGTTLRITGIDGRALGSIRLVDGMGRSVLSFRSNNSSAEFSLGTLPSGIYVLSVGADDVDGLARRIAIIQ